MNQFTDAVNSYKEELIKSLQECIQVKSISGNQEETLHALNFFLNLGISMDFKATNIDNLGGVIEFGEGEKVIGIIAHMDTVPEGTGWTYPPFEGQIHDGKIYGRGAIDDKGPSISALYALKILKDSGIQPKCKIKIIIGIDEETLWNATPKLLEKIQEPDFSFVPDAKFPIVIAEKGLLWFELNKSFRAPDLQRKPGIIIKKILGGSDSLNIVPDYCEAILALPKEEAETIQKNLQRLQHNQNPYNIGVEPDGTDLKLFSRGKSTHAFSCDEGRNAISQLILFLNELDIVPEQKEFLQTYTHKIGLEYYGQSLGLGLEDELTGKLTVNPGYIFLDEKSVTLKVDIRFPASENLANMKTKLQSSFQPFQGNLTIIDSLASLCFSEDDPHIRKLLKVYRDYTGDQKARPLGMGGTTFSKAFRNAVSFGPTFPGMAKVEHQPDEYMEIDHLLKCTEIYALALKELAFTFL